MNGDGPPPALELSSPGRDPLRLFLVPFDEARFDADAFAAAGLDFPESIRRSVPARQAAFFHGRIAARDALRDQGADAFHVGIGDRREPLWPAGFVGSISHTRGWAGAVAAPAARHLGVGIDLERTAQGNAVKALEKLALDAAELALLRRPDATLPYDARVTLAFSAKESFYKAVFGLVRRVLGFEVVRLVELDEREGAIVLRIEQDLHDRLPAGARCRLGFAPVVDGLFVTWFDAV